MHFNKAKRYFLLFILLCFLLTNGDSQTIKMYPPLTKWYHDPLGLRPIQLSSAPGFPWASAVIAACIIFTRNDSLFQKRVSFYHETGAGFGYKSPYTNSFQSDFGLMYAIRNWMVLGLGLPVFHFKDEVNDTWCFGFRPFMRWYPYKRKKIKLFFEYGGGCSYSLNRFPLTGTGWESDTARTGTKFNFLSKYGIGSEIEFGKSLSMQLGIRHSHLSNGNIKGVGRNPSYDCNGLFLGLIYRLKKYSS